MLPTDVDKIMEGVGRKSKFHSVEEHNTLPVCLAKQTEVVGANIQHLYEQASVSALFNRW